VDYDSQVRRRAIGEAIAALDTEATSDVAPIPLFLDQANFLDDLGSWIPEFLSAIKRSLVQDGAEVRAALLAAVDELGRFRHRVNATEMARPFVYFTTSASRIVRELDGVARGFLGACLASTPLEAERLGGSGQEHLDRLAELADDLDRHVAEVRQLTDLASTSDLLVRLMWIASGSTGEPVFLDASAIHAQRLEKVLGDSVDLGVAIDYGMCAVIAEAALDVDRFHTVLKESYWFFLRDVDALRRLTANVAFREDHSAVALEVFDACVAASTVMANSQVPRQALRGFLEMIASLVEGPGQLIASSVLLLSGQRTSPYERLRLKDATEVIRAVTNARDAEQMVRGFDLDVRTAVSHRAVQYLDEGVVLTSRSAASREMGFIELADLAYLAMETTLATLLGLRCAAAKHGIDVAAVSDLGALGISPEEQARMVIAAFSGADTTILEVDPTWTFQVNEMPMASRAGLLGALAWQLQPETPDIAIRIVDEGVTHEYRGPASALRRWWTAIDELEKDLALVRVYREWSWDGEPVMPEASVRKWVAIRAGKSGSTEFADEIRLLRRLRTFAGELNDDQMADVMAGLISHRRTADTALTGRKELRALELLAEWCEADVELNPAVVPP
jgi:hypothetical protein